MKIFVKIQQLEHSQSLPLPTYATEGSAGLDLMAAIMRPITLQSHHQTLVPTGICIELPKGYEAQIRPRSGLAVNFGITVLNSPGTIDTDYRGEIKVILINLGQKDFIIEKGMRIAQMVITKYEQAQVTPVLSVVNTLRGSSGFGSTGM